MLTDLSSLLLVFLGLLFFISLVSFSQADPSLNHAVSGNREIENWAGIFGAYLAGLMADLLGISSYFLALGVFGLALSRSIPDFELVWWRWLGLFLLALCVAAAGSFGDIGIGEIKGGGILGQLMSSGIVALLSIPGAVLTWIFFIIASIYMITGLSWLSLIKIIMPKQDKSAGQNKPVGQEVVKPRIYSVTAKVEQEDKKEVASVPAKVDQENKKKVESKESAKIELKKSAFVSKINSLFSSFKGLFKKSVLAAEQKSPPKAKRSISKAIGTKGKLALTPAYDEDDNFHFDSDDIEIEGGNEVSALPVPEDKRIDKALPSIELLTELKVEQSIQGVAEIEAKGRDLMACLADFSIQGKLQRIVPGPVVTMFEIKPAPGVKVSRISSLSDDIALAMRAISVRVQAPIPGTDTVGIEIPNAQREMVSFRDIVASPAFINSKALMTMALGKDITGAAAVADLAKMPHLLVAGATGAGKSVCLNSILLSLIYKATPDELKLLLIDPKRIELAVYADLPHLVHPVVTEMVQAKSALDWAIHEMDRRYKAIAQLGVRNIAGFNEKLAELKKAQPETVETLESMPYLVIIIDELADLMLTAGKEVEVAIVRLAQLARAAGIHLIIATQRPSVDVVTGLIKANFPCRISFQVTSKHDSRTILDTVGAEHLLGKGDMLMKPGGGRMQRLHGAFVPDEDVVASVAFWKKLMPPRYEVDLSDWGTSENGAGKTGDLGSPGSLDVADDPLYRQAVDFVTEQGKASISLIQRRFRIGFNKAARFVEQMEQDGIIGPADGSRPRQIIK